MRVENERMLLGISPELTCNAFADSFFGFQPELTCNAFAGSFFGFQPELTCNAFADSFFGFHLRFRDKVAATCVLFWFL